MHADTDFIQREYLYQFIIERKLPTVLLRRSDLSQRTRPSGNQVVHHDVRRSETC